MGTDHSKLAPVASRLRHDALLSLLLRQEWESAHQRIKNHPKEATVYLNPAYSPLHVACSLPNVPLRIIQALIQADPEGPLRSSGSSMSADGKQHRRTMTASSGTSNFSLSSDGSGVLSSASSESTGMEDPGAWLPLHVAVSYGTSVEVVEYLIDQCPSSVVCKNGQGLLPLHLACQRAGSVNLGVVSLLLEAFPASRFIPSSSCTNGKTALELVMEQPDGAPPELVELLRGTNEASPSTRHFVSPDEFVLQSVHVDPSSSPPKRRRKLFQSLRPSKDPQAPTKLVLHVTSRRWTDALDRLSRHPEEASVWTLCNAPRDPPCHSLPLHMALRRRAPLTVIQALQANCPESIGTREYYGMMPLHVACQAGATLDVVQFLTELHPEAVRTPDLLGLYPLHLACLSEASQVNVITFLLDAYPESMNLRDEKGYLALDYVRNGCHPHQRLLEAEFAKGTEYWAAVPNELVQMLCRRQWDAALTRLESHPDEATVWTKHPVNGKRRYALHMACRDRAREDVIKALVDIHPGAAKISIDEFQLLPLHLAAHHGASVGVVKILLLAYPEASSCADWHGLIPLHLAVTEGAPLEVVEALVEAFPEGVLATDGKGFTPLVYAESSFHPRAKQVLNLLQSVATGKDIDVISDCSDEASRVKNDAVPPFDESDHEIHERRLSQGSLQSLVMSIS